MAGCTLCPRRYGVIRTQARGFCGAPDTIYLARAARHDWEEPCISGTNGSGALFFSGCSLRCCYCQNAVISHQMHGTPVTVSQLRSCMLHLEQEGVHNLNLVTGTQYVPQILEALDPIKSRLSIPVIWNTSGYETLETLALLNGYIDIYLPDFKYIQPETAKRLSMAADYPTVAKAAILEMIRQTGPLQWNGTLLQRGTIIRHLVLPGHRKESMAILDWLAAHTQADHRLVSIMGQYTPMPGAALPEHALSRTITTMEYDSVVQHAAELDLQGYCQERSAAGLQFIPDFSENPVSFLDFA